MTRRLITLLAVAFVAWPTNAPGAPHVLAVRCGTLIADASRPPLRDATIIITDGTITDVGTGVAIPAGAEQLDLRAFTVMPGLVDALAHLCTGPLTSQTVSDPLATLRASKAVAFLRARCEIK